MAATANSRARFGRRTPLERRSRLQCLDAGVTARQVGTAGGAGTDVVMYYRVGVRDQTGVDSMICKSAGPSFTPIGNWTSMFANGFE